MSGHGRGLLALSGGASDPAAVTTPTPSDLLAALDGVPEAKAKWLALPDSARLAYLRWVEGPRYLRRGRVAGTVSRVLHDQPQKGLWGRVREGASTLGDEISGGNYPPYTGAGTDC